MSSDKCEAEETVDDVLESLRGVTLAIHPGNPLHENLETILQKVPTELRDRMNRRPISDENHPDAPSEKALVRLHKQVLILLILLFVMFSRYFYFSCAPDTFVSHVLPILLFLMFT